MEYYCLHLQMLFQGLVPKKGEFFHHKEKRWPFECMLPLICLLHVHQFLQFDNCSGICQQFLGSTVRTIGGPTQICDPSALDFQDDRNDN